MRHANITIYHNPRCSKSRETLKLIVEAGYEPNVIEYLQTPLDKPGLQALVKRLGIPVREMLRTGEEAYKALALGDANKTDEARLEAVLAHPILMNRPIVVTEKGACICRPPELVHALLP